MVGEGDIHSDFDTSGVVSVVCHSCNILVQESDIQTLMLCHCKDYSLVL